MKPYLLLCVCGFAQRAASWSALASLAALHREEAAEGCDHVVSICYSPSQGEREHAHV